MGFRCRSVTLASMSRDCDDDDVPLRSSPEGLQKLAGGQRSATAGPEPRIARILKGCQNTVSEVFMCTFLSLPVNIIFRTKHRNPWIVDGWIERFHEYIGGTIRALDGVPESVGGIVDHV